jgi:hypothetical protein
MDNAKLSQVGLTFLENPMASSHGQTRSSPLSRNRSSLDAGLMVTIQTTTHLQIDEMVGKRFVLVIFSNLPRLIYTMRYSRTI